MAGGSHPSLVRLLSQSPGGTILGFALGTALMTALVLGARELGEYYWEQNNPTQHNAVLVGTRLASTGSTDPTELARVAEAHADVLVAEDVSPCEDAATRVRCSRIETEHDEGIGMRQSVSCWRYTVRASVHDHEPTEVDCPENAEPLAMPPASAPALPLGIHDVLRTTLAGLVAADTTDEDAVWAAVSSLPGIVDQPAVLVEVTRQEGTVGIVVGIPVEADCVGARILADETVDVWQVPPDLAQPGQDGCDAGLAAAGDNRQPPG